MKENGSTIEQELYRSVARMAAAEAPDGWTIAVLKFEILRSVPRHCLATLDYVDSTGHVIWFETPHAVLDELGRAALRFHAVSPERGGRPAWTRASLTLSPHEVIAADFWVAVSAG